MVSEEKMNNSFLNGHSEKNSGQMDENFDKLQDFSNDLIKLGQEISERFKEKERLETEIFAKEKEARGLQLEVFRLKEKLIKLNLGMAELEERRKQLEGV